jgi:hypothetical protein
MAIPFSISDDNASISTTEYSLPADSTTLTAQTTVATVQAMIDFSSMIAGDQYRIRVYESINGGSQLVVWESVIEGVQPGPLVTPVLMLGNGWNVTVQRLAGSDRTIKWSIRKDTGDRALGAGAITSSSFATDAIDANALKADAATEIATAVWAIVSEGSETVKQTLVLIAARLFGKATVQDGDGSYTFRDAADSKNRLVMARSGTARTVSTRDGT